MFQSIFANLDKREISSHKTATETINGVNLIGNDEEIDITNSKTNLASSVSESNQGTSAAEDIEEDSKGQWYIFS